MRIAVCLFGALLAVSLPGLPQEKKAPAADMQAFRDARRISDPQAKIDALRGFVALYPKSSLASTARSLLLETLVKYFPARTNDIERQVNAVLKHAQGELRMYGYDDVASTLADGNVLLPRAERISQKSLKVLREKTYSAGMRKVYIEAKMKPPGDADLHRKFLTARSGFEATLGRIYVKQGKVTEGQPLLKSAYTDDPDDSVATAELGSLAAKDGKSDEALTYLTRARLTGKLDDSQQKLLERLYATKQGGSIGGFEDYLDEHYKALFPDPFKVVKYQAEGNASNRTVLEELFTGSGCDPCAGADLAIDAELERYSRKELVLLAFDQHIPEPDPLANPDSVKRFNFYQGTGTPTLALDGTTKIIGADRNGAKERFEEINTLVEKDLQSPAEVLITLTASRSSGLVVVHAAAARIKSASKDLALQIALVEDELRYSGENGIRFHPMVVRSVARGGEGFALEPGKGCEVEYKFDIAEISDGLKNYLDGYEKSNDRFGPITFLEKMYKINPAGLSVVAFVQDMKTKTVLQAAYMRVANSQ
jgi:tetratricopeptide (TPR) repeat protein